MAKKCHGRWINSKINDVEDGEIEVDEGTGGVLTGKHKNSDKSIIGLCSGGAKPHITFARVEPDGCVYVYHGEMVLVMLPKEHFVVPKGKGTVTVVCPPTAVDAKGRGRTQTPDEWVAEQDVT